MMADSPEAMVPDRVITDPRYSFGLLFLIALAVLWFSCNNAAKEIVKEEAVYGRERAVNLGIFPYLASKFVVLSVVTAFQVLVFLVCIYGFMALADLVFGMPQPLPFVVVNGRPQ